MTGDFSWISGLFTSIWGWGFILLLLGGSIFVHEMGHFLAARWRGLKVDSFSIGFGPKIFGWKGKDGVEYRISWIPLGGYVKLPQLADMRDIEGGPSADMAELPPVSYLDKMIVVSAGVVFNLLLALVLSLLLWPLGMSVPASAQTQVVGYVFHTMGELKEGMQKRELSLLRGPDAPKFDNTPAPAEGKILPGDKILAVDGAPLHDFRELAEKVAFSSGRDQDNHPKVTLTIERDGSTKDIDVLPALIDTNSRSGDALREIGLSPADNLVVDDITPNSPAFLAHVHMGDAIFAVNGQKVYSYLQMNELIDSAAGQPLALTVQRGDQKVDLSLQPLPVPRTTPLATITVGGADGATVDILPVYARDESGNRASPATATQSLLVWNVDNRGGAFGSLHPGDFLLKVNDQPVKSIQQVVDAMKSTPAGQAAVLTYASQDTHANANLTLSANFGAEITPPGMTNRIGLLFRMASVTEHTSPPEQFARAFGQVFSMLRSLFNPHSNIGIGQLSGPIGISRLIYQFSIQDVRAALWFAFIVNVNLAILNLMPIPVLDGGHILFFTIARLRRRELPINFIAATQMVCMVLLLTMALYVSFKDSRRWLGDNERESEVLRDNYYILHDDDMKFPAAPAQK